MKIPALRLERLKYVARHYIRPETLIAANAMIVDYHAKLPLVIEWGGGEVAITGSTCSTACWTRRPAFARSRS